MAERVLIVVPPFTGHVNPTLGVGAELLDRGHRVAWCGYRLPELPAGGESFTLHADDPLRVAEGVRNEGSNLRGLRSVKYFFEEVVVPLAHAMLPHVRRVIELWKPTRVLVDQQALAGAFAARLAGIPWFSSCSTSASVVEPMAEFPKVLEWRDNLLAELQQALGLVVERRPGLSARGTLVFSSAELIGETLPAHVHCVGPVVTARPEVPFPWDWLDERPGVLISLGTISGGRGERFYQAVADAFDGLNAQGVLVAPEGLTPTLPSNVRRFDFVPQVQLLERLSATVSHAGHNTVVESLLAGVPLVVLPIRDDQPVVANQVVRTGAGLRLKFGSVRGERLRVALQRVLEEASFRQAAHRIGISLRASGGASRAADVVLQRG